ncbi:MAG: hypothetical protein HP049_02285 [Clostridiales bacterium]|nr:hypothetical protein [Clostridiales bacterium]
MKKRSKNCFVYNLFFIATQAREQKNQQKIADFYCAKYTNLSLRFLHSGKLHKTDVLRMHAAHGAPRRLSVIRPTR